MLEWRHGILAQRGPSGRHFNHPRPQGPPPPNCTTERPPEFWTRPPSFSDKGPSDVGPNWARPAERKGFLKLNDSANLLSLDPHSKFVYKFSSDMVSRLDYFSGFPTHQTLNEEQERRFHIVDDLRSQKRAFEEIIKDAQVLPFGGLDSESRIGETSTGGGGINSLAVNRNKYVSFCTGLGTVVIYCLQPFRFSVKDALGKPLLDLLAGKDPNVKVFYTIGVAVWGDQEKLQITFDNAVDIRGAYNDMASSGFFTHHVGDKNGLKAFSYMIYGESHSLIFPANEQDYAKKRRGMLETYRTDPGPRGNIIYARDMYRMFSFDGSRINMREEQAIYMALDVTVPVASVFVDVLRYLQSGRGKHLSLKGHVLRSLFDMKKTYVPPSSLDWKDSYYLDYFGREAMEKAEQHAIARAKGPRKRTLIKERDERLGYEGESDMVPMNNPTLTPQEEQMARGIVMGEINRQKALSGDVSRRIKDTRKYLANREVNIIKYFSFNNKFSLISLFLFTRVYKDINILKYFANREVNCMLHFLFTYNKLI